MRTPIGLLLLLAACSSPKAAPDPNGATSLGRAIDTEDYVSVSPGIERARELPIGAFLGEVGLRVRGWERARLEADAEQLRLLGEVLEFECARRQDEMIEQLESGPPRNRALAAVGLGFARHRSVLKNDLSTEELDAGAASLGPLLAAIDDPDPKVAANALMGLGILGRPETPLAPLTRALVEFEDPSVRSNAAYALTAILKTIYGPEGESGQELSEEQRAAVSEALVHSLGDADLGVRTQASAALGLVGRDEAIAFLGDRLDDEVALVGQAASVALVLIGKREPRLKGRVARLLADRLDRVRPSRRDTVLYGLVLLSGRQMGDSTEVWQDWARRLPAS